MGEGLHLNRGEEDKVDDKHNGCVHGGAYKKVVCNFPAAPVTLQPVGSQGHAEDGRRLQRSREALAKSEQSGGRRRAERRTGQRSREKSREEQRIGGA